MPVEQQTDAAAAGTGEHILASPRASESAPTRAALRAAAGRTYLYLGLLTAATLASGLVTPGARPSDEPAYAVLGVGLIAGALLAVRLRPGEAGTTLVLIPTLVGEFRFGMATLPALAFATLIAGLLRGVRGPALLAGAAYACLACVVAHSVARLAVADPVWQLVVFGVTFAASRWALWRAGEVVRSPSVAHPRAERPDVAICLALAPLAALPLVAFGRFGDNGLALGLAALLAMLALVVEARNLATARAEAALQRDQLARANELQQDLLHLITHELKNPLTSVLIYSQLVERALANAQPARAADFVPRIQQSARTLERLVENLLQLSRLESTGELPPSEPIALAELATGVIRDLEALAEQKRQQLTMDVAESLPMVSAPPVLLREALSNLVSNAIKYTPDGGEVRVWGSVGAGSPAAEVVLGVSDTGIGLSPDDSARLFTKFFRSTNPAVRNERGSGMGLALTHAIIRRMGGRIEVESRPNEGSTFRIVLPVRP